MFGRESIYGVTQAAAGDRILTFNDVLAIARGAGLLKVQSLRAGFGRGGMVQTGRDAWAGRVRAEASLHCIHGGKSKPCIAFVRGTRGSE